MDKAADGAVPLTNIFDVGSFERRQESDGGGIPAKILEDIIRLDEEGPFVKAQTSLGRDRFLILKVASAQATAGGQIGGKHQLQVWSLASFEVSCQL